MASDAARAVGPTAAWAHRQLEEEESVGVPDLFPTNSFKSQKVQQATARIPVYQVISYLEDVFLEESPSSSRTRKSHVYTANVLWLKYLIFLRRRFVLSQILNDPRVRLEMRLREAGLEIGDYARSQLARLQPGPAPQLAQSKAFPFWADLNSNFSDSWVVWDVREHKL